MTRESQILAKANILLAIEKEATDEEIYAYSEKFSENRLKTLVDIIKESNKENKVRFFSDFLVEKYPEEKQFLLLEAIKMILNCENRTRAEELLTHYTEEFGEDRHILIEKLAYYMKYEYRNINRIQAILEQINAMEIE